MKWFLLAIMTNVYNGGLDKDTYIWKQPTFDNLEQCREWVQNNNASIFLHLKSVFPNDRMDRLLCINQERLQDFIENGASPRQPQRGTDA